MLYNNQNNYKFHNGVLYEINGFNPEGDTDQSGKGLLGINFGNLTNNYSSDRVYSKVDNSKKVIFYPGAGMVMASTDRDIEKIQDTYGMRWIYLNYEIIGKDTVYYFKILYPGQ